MPRSPLYRNTRWQVLLFAAAVGLILVPGILVLSGVRALLQAMLDLLKRSPPAR